jgi:hypothetical protein
MSSSKTSYRRFLWPGLAIVAMAALITFFFTARKTRTQSSVTVAMDAKGVPRVAGIPLVTTNIREATFTAMGALGIKAELAIPNGATNAGQESNVIATLRSMGSAGLFATNRISNSYE